MPSASERVPSTVVPSVAAVTPAVEMSAGERLAASRGRLREAMMAVAHPPPRSRSTGAGFLHQVPDDLLAAVRKLPGVAIVIEAVKMWWEQHPLRPAGAIAQHAARRIVAPMVQRSPFAFIGSALVIGAVLMVARPWRWLLRPALFVGIVPQLVAQVMKRLPAETMVRMVSNLLQKRAAPKRTAAKRAPAAASPPPPL